MIKTNQLVNTYADNVVLDSLTIATGLDIRKSAEINRRMIFLLLDADKKSI